MNPLFNSFGNQAQQLKNSFKGNPRDEVQKLLNSGQMSQSDFNKLSQMAQQIMQSMGFR